MPSFLRRVRAYYRGSKDQDQQAFYDLESSLPFFDHVSRVLCAQKRWLLSRWIRQHPPAGPVLEIGGGIGTFARQMGKRGHRVVALDISPAKTAKAQAKTDRLAARRTDVHVQHVAGDMTELGSGGRLDADIGQAASIVGALSFSAIIAADVIEHVPTEPQETLATIRSVLATDGRFYPSVPSRLWLNDPGHIWKLLPRDWEREFERAGFEQIRKRLCWIFLYGIPTPVPLAVSYELVPRA